jgi:hypothetical protein
MDGAVVGASDVAYKAAVDRALNSPKVARAKADVF